MLWMGYIYAMDEVHLCYGWGTSMLWMGVHLCYGWGTSMLWMRYIYDMDGVHLCYG